ncbi:MAG: sensory rhodopsin transducer, partial [Clostridia bacterium]
EPVRGIHLTVEAERVHCFRMDYPLGEAKFEIPFGQYAVVLESSVPVVCLYGRLDRRPDMAYYPIAGFSV